MWPDPRTSPLIPRGPDTSTIRIVTPFDFAEWKIVEQNRDKSVLKGLAGVGGLWTFIGGIFTALFGSSIIRIIFGACRILLCGRYTKLHYIGTKPISLFGITRSFVGDKIGDACRTEYPRLESDLKVNPEFKSFHNRETR